MKIAIAGCSGRMGLTLVKAVLAHPQLTLVCGSERAGFDVELLKNHLALYGAQNLPVTSNPHELVEKTDAVIDFTTPEATLAVAEALAAKGGIHIIGTTGFSGEQQKKIASLASQARIVQSGNFSLGVALLASLVEKAAAALDDHYDIEINEMHHRHKKDAPSGTALMLGRAAAAGRKVDFEKKKRFSYAAPTLPLPLEGEGSDVVAGGGERQVGDIGFSVMRGGDVVGIHDVIFAGPGETLTFSHQGFDRSIYVNGALKAALWAKNQKPGLYTIGDVLGVTASL